MLTVHATAAASARATGTSPILARESVAPSAAKTKMAVARSSATASRSVPAGSVAVARRPTLNRRRPALMADRSIYLTS
jgi:hypothetical protein